MKVLKQILPGLILTSIIALLSIYISNYIILGSKSIAIIIGILIGNIFFKSKNLFTKGVSFSEKTILSLAIILFGSQLDITSLSLINYHTFLFLMFMIFFSIIICLIIGRVVGLPNKTSLLIGIGNGICGSAAIASASKLLNSKKDEIGISVAIINAIGVLSIFIFPLIITFIPLFNNEKIGLLIGSTIQAFGQVAATGFIISDDVGKFASLIKMIRISMLGPVLIVLNILITRFENTTKSNKASLFNIPFFIIGFLLFSLFSSFNILSDNILLILKTIANFLLTVAMVSIGFNISIKNIFQKSSLILLVALIGFIIQVVIAILIIDII